MEFANINYNTNLFEYLPVVLFLIIAIGIISLALISSFMVVPRNYYDNKLTAYECGFDALDNTDKQFDIRFYLVAILFIIFDIELIFMYPWVLALADLGMLGFSSMMVFIFVLLIGFIYEWKKGALSWT